MMRCVKSQNDRLHLTTRKENVTVTTSDKINKNENSSQSCREHPISGHSTPVIKMQSTNHAEESPDFDYYQSPILPPCTQEGGNEIAWDWQSSQNKTPESRNKRPNIQCETPKGTKLLQRKRNSNSPLLYKPLKRKIENIENIGQFAAELQALNERMRVMKQNNKNHANDHVEDEVPTLANTSSKEEMSRIENNEQNYIKETSNHNTSKYNANRSYDDLFDDSVDDDMIRCTQEIEEKFNLIADKGNSIHSQANIKKEESSCANNASNIISVQFTSNENFRELTRGISCKGTNNTNTLRTYSKFPLKRDTNSGIHAAAQRGEDLHKSCSNNNTIHSYFRKPCDNKKLSKSNSTELFNFLDDSFDDFLATCVEDEKLLSTSAGSDDTLANTKQNTKFEASCKRLTHAPLKSEAKPINFPKFTTRLETSRATLLENRKFFKTKSLSDQSINQNAIVNAKNTTNATSACYTARPMLRANSAKSSTISHTSIRRASVSTNPIVTNDRKVENSAITLTHGTDRTYGSDIDRCAVKGDGDRFVRHHSTGNMKNSTREMTKTGSQPARCTAEEIERKRLQALMRLEARRKLHSAKITNNINR